MPTLYSSFERNPRGSTCRVRTPSGLDLEVMPPRRKPLWPLMLGLLVIWGLVAWAVWFCWVNLF